MRREAVMISKIPAPPSKLEIFQTTVHKKAVFFLELSPDEAPLCLFMQTLIRLVDFYWLSKKERSQVEREMTNKVRQRDPLSCRSLIWSSGKCVPYPSYTPHHHLIILHLPTHTHTCICPEHPNKSLSFILLFQKSQERHRERNYETRSLHSF